MWYIQQLLCAFPLITWSGLVEFSRSIWPSDLGLWMFTCLSSNLWHWFEIFIMTASLPSKLFSSSTLLFPNSLSHGSIHHTQLPPLSECCWIKAQDPLTELLAFICGVIKMLHKQVSGLPPLHGVCTPFFCLLSFVKIWMSLLEMRDLNYCVIICSPPSSSTVRCNARNCHKGETQH